MYKKTTQRLFDLTCLLAGWFCRFVLVLFLQSTLLEPAVVKAQGVLFAYVAVDDRALTWPNRFI
jgi:hypothetical protein